MSAGMVAARSTGADGRPQPRDVTPELYALAVVIGRVGSPELASLVAMLTAGPARAGQSE